MKISKLVVFILGIFVLSGVCLGYNPTDFDCSPYLDGSERMVGDVNGDGQVNGVDSHMVSMYLAHLIDFDSSYGNCCVDVDADSKVSVKDVLYIEKYVIL